MSGFLGVLRWAWNQLTSMRTALVLLFLLALAAIPGSMIPQRSTTPIGVLDFKEEYPTLAKIYEPLGLFDVYGSPWFAAVYLLLFISLIGCILPRIGVYFKALRTPPPKLPKRLDRLPEFAAVTSDDTAASLDRAQRWLRSKRFRVVRSEEGLSAERGYLREAGNLVFHLGLVVVLIGLAWSNVSGFKGTAVVVEGQGFSNNITQYDDFTAGALVDTEKLVPFTMKLNEFVAAFETGEVQRGAARRFEAHVDVIEGDKTTQRVIEVNHPLEFGRTKVHLLSHGYAARITVRDGNGDVAYSGPVVFLPQDANYTSVGVIKVPDARPQRLAFEGVFLPTAFLDEKGPHSVFPDAFNVELYLNAWVGAPKDETGRPENVYTLDTTGMEQVKNDAGEPLRVRLTPGTGFDLPGGGGSLTFEGWQRWVKIQISDTPGLGLALGALVVAVLGITLSLFVRPRRLWVKVVDGRIEVGGLDRTDAATGLDEDVRALADTASGAPDEKAQSAP